MAGKFSKFGANDTNKPTRYYSKKQEDSVAALVGGKVTPNSGATPWTKGDVQTSGSNSFLIECKTKTSPSQSITIKKEWFEKNRDEMIFNNKEHQAIVFSFGPGEENHYIIDGYLFLELLEYLNNK